MVDSVITKQELIDAQKDALSLEQVTNGTELQSVTSRLGQTYPTIAKALRTVIESGGYEPFLTQQALLLSVPTAAKKAAKALDTKKIFFWNGSSWIDTGKSEIEIANEYAEDYVNVNSLNLFAQFVDVGYTNNMTVRRYTAASTFNDYAAGTYQSIQGDKVKLSVPSGGSNAIKHYFNTAITYRDFDAEFKLSLANFAGDAVGVGFKIGENNEIIALSSTGNLLRINNFGTTVLSSGLGNHVVGDVVRYSYRSGKIEVFLNGFKKGEATISAGGTIIVGQMGFSQYVSDLGSGTVDPIRDYVQTEISKIPTPDPNVLPQAKEYTEEYVQAGALDLFRQQSPINLPGNMTVTRFTAAATSNSYPAGTYQVKDGSKVNLNVIAGGSNAIKHYYVSDLPFQPMTIEFEITKQNVAGDAVGIGFKSGPTFDIIAFSNSGNLLTVSDYTTSVVTSGLGGYELGDTLKFIISEESVKIYVNDSFKAERTVAFSGNLIIGQSGFSHYQSSAYGESIDPIRDYVKEEISNSVAKVASSGFYSFTTGVSPLLGVFNIYTQVKDTLYVGFEVKHEYDMREAIYQDYWRIVRADFYKFEDGIMQPTGKTALGIGESEFVLKTNASKVDFTGGYHGDELVTDIKFLADGILIPTTANIALTACEQFEYVEKSTMHETADANGVIAGHPKISDHIKHTVFKNAGYKTVNKCTWNYDGLMTIIYHGISCIHKDVATTVFSDDTYTDQAMTGSTNNYFNAIGARLYKGRNEANGLAVEAAAYQVTPGDKDALSEFFVHDRSTDSKYYRKTPAGNVATGGKHESYFECKFLAI